MYVVHSPQGLSYRVSQGHNEIDKLDLRNSLSHWNERKLKEPGLNLQKSDENTSEQHRTLYNKAQPVPLVFDFITVQ